MLEIAGGIILAVLFLAALPFILVAAWYVLVFAGWVPMLVVGLLIISDQWPPATIDLELLLGLGLSAFGATRGARVLWALVQNSIEEAKARPQFVAEVGGPPLGSIPRPWWWWAAWAAGFALFFGSLVA